jgi:anti-sigma-K factor RskA
MRLDRHPLLDALCGEYLVGTLRGAARRRFEALLASDPRLALRLQTLQTRFNPGTRGVVPAAPSDRVWRNLSQSLELHRYRTPWYRRPALWQGWAWASTAALAVVVGVQLNRTVPQSEVAAGPALAQLTGKDGIAPVSAQISADGKQLILHAARPVIAGPNQSYELWLIPAGGKPLAVAVLGNLDATFPIPADTRAQLNAGTTLAVSTEPPGGSPTGQPTGTVILAGKINS